MSENIDTTIRPCSVPKWLMASLTGEWGFEKNRTLIYPSEFLMEVFLALGGYSEDFRDRLPLDITISVPFD